MYWQRKGETTKGYFTVIGKDIISYDDNRFIGMDGFSSWTLG